MIRPVPFIGRNRKNILLNGNPWTPCSAFVLIYFPIEVNVLVNLVNLASCMLYDVIAQLTPYLTWLWIALSDYNGDPL